MTEFYGLDGDGYDEDGYNLRTGFNEYGVHRYGFKRDGLHAVTGTFEDEEGFTFEECMGWKRINSEVKND